MKILLISPFLPYAQAKSGAPRAIFDRLQLLSLRHDVSLATFVTPSEASYQAGLEQLGVRVYDIVGQENGAARSGLKLWRKRVRLAAGLLMDRRPMLVQEFGSKPMCRLLKRLVREQQFHVAMVEHILMAQYIPCLQQHVDLPIILTEHDVRAAFPGKPNRRRRSPSLFGMPLALIDQAKWATYACAGYKQATCVVVPSKEDARLLEKNMAGVSAQVVPFGLASDRPTIGNYEQSPQPAPGRETDTLLFVGNFDHPPNRDATHWLCSEIMPLIWRERPQVELWLVGRNPTPSIEALGNRRIRVWGEVPSVSKYLHSCTIFVAPLRQGGGMRIKLLEALAAGTPTITTTLGAQGLHAESGRHLLVADGAGDFARCVLRTLGDPALRDRLSAEGADLVSGKRRKTERVELLERVLANAVAEKTNGAIVGVEP